MATHRSSHDHRWATIRQPVAAISMTLPPIHPDDSSMDDDVSFTRNGRIRKDSLMINVPYASFLAFCRSWHHGISVRFHSLSFSWGILCGVLLTLVVQHQYSHVQNTRQFHATTTTQSLSRSSFQFLPEVPAIESQSHAGIHKQTLIRPLAVHPDLVGISVATIQPGQAVTMHVHETMHEFFYIYQGSVEITVDGNSNHGQTTTSCGLECFFHAVPGEAHAFATSSDAHVDTKMLMFQLAIQSSDVCHSTVDDGMLVGMRLKYSRPDASLQQLLVGAK